MISFDPTDEQLELSEYLAIDPGETTGWALFDEQGNVVLIGQTLTKTAKDQVEVFNRLIPRVRQVIAEDYKNFAWKRQKNWSRNQTSKNIGGLETICAMHNVPIFLQGSQYLPIGLKWAGMKDGLPSNHSISHQYSAYGHGVYYLVTHGIRSAGKAIIDRKEN